MTLISNCEWTATPVDFFVICAMRHICPISGKDSFATAMLLRREDLPLEYVWHDTGWELPEVYEWIDKAEKHLGQPIIRCGDDLTEIVAEQGLLPSPMRRFCTKYAKIKPMNEFVGKHPFTLYLGLRADEPDRIAGLRPSKWETHRFPLQENGLDMPAVWEMVAGADMLPPLFVWQWMIDRVAELGGRRPEGMPNWEWWPLFSGRSRPNCDRCFYQRLYEWIWLWETHPDRFESAVETEESTQHASDFRWLGKGKPLGEVWKRAEQIKERRARQIVRHLNDLNAPKLFDDLVKDNPFGATSCGLFCGK